MWVRLDPECQVNCVRLDPECRVNCVSGLTQHVRLTVCVRLETKVRLTVYEAWSRSGCVWGLIYKVGLTVKLDPESQVNCVWGLTQKVGLTVWGLTQKVQLTLCEACVLVNCVDEVWRSGVYDWRGEKENLKESWLAAFWKRSKDTKGFKECLFIRTLQNDMHVIRIAPFSKQQINRHHKKKWLDVQLAKVERERNTDVPVKRIWRKEYDSCKR